MAWSELDLDKGTWTLPKERSKNRLAHTLPITAMMARIIGSVLRRAGHDTLFGVGRTGFTTWRGGKEVLDAKVDIPPWTVHDLRRSTATGMANLAVQPHVIEAVLNHVGGSKAGVAGVYNRSPYEREVKAAMAMWSDHIASITTGSARKVVPLRPA
jgi:integrase